MHFHKWISCVKMYLLGTTSSSCFWCLVQAYLHPMHPGDQWCSKTGWSIHLQTTRWGHCTCCDTAWPSHEWITIEGLLSPTPRGYCCYASQAFFHGVAHVYNENSGRFVTHTYPWFLNVSFLNLRQRQTKADICWQILPAVATLILASMSCLKMQFLDEYLFTAGFKTKIL